MNASHPLKPKNLGEIFCNALFVISIISIPFAVAFQNIAMGLIAILLLANVFSKAKFKLNKRALVLTFIALFYCLWNIFSSILNTSFDNPKLTSFPFGYLTWMLFPLVCAGYYSYPLRYYFQRFKKLIFSLLIIWVLVLISQQLWGWKVEGISLTRIQDRPRGFYSHPLTLAYIGLILFCYFYYKFIESLNNFSQNRIYVSAQKELLQWLILAALGFSLVVFSNSRAALGGTLLFAVLITVLNLRNRWRLIILAAGLVLGITIASTDNSVSRKWKNTFSQEGVDKHGGEADDRIIFWKVYYNIIAQRPWVGHGINLHTEFRTPYYEQMGYGEFKKKYEAHNIFIQILANSGIIGLTLFLSWVIYFAYALAKQGIPNQVKRSVVVFIGCFLLASQFQNSFQDSEVRFLLSVMAGFSFLPKES